MKERCQIIKEKFTKNNKLINSCNEIHGACRHEPRLHRFKVSSSSADESCEDKRVTTPSKNKKGKKKRRDSTESVESTGSNHSILSSSNSVFTCSTRKKKSTKKRFLTRVRKNLPIRLKNFCVCPFNLIQFNLNDLLKNVKNCRN